MLDSATTIRRPHLDGAGNTDRNVDIRCHDFAAVADLPIVRRIPVSTAARDGCRREISMDGKGVWRDNVFVERLWRTIKYEEVYLHAYTSVPETRTAIARYLIFYNTRRLISSLDRKTPDRAYFNTPKPILAAA